RGAAAADVGEDDAHRPGRAGAGEVGAAAAHVSLPDDPALAPLGSPRGELGWRYTSIVKYPTGFSRRRRTGSATLKTGTPPRVAPLRQPRWAWPWMATLGRSWSMGPERRVAPRKGKISRGSPSRVWRQGA